MSVIQTLQNLLGNTRISPTSAGIKQIRTALAVEQTASADYRNARTHLLRLHNALERLAEVADVDTRLKLDLPDARSTAGIGLDMTHTAALLNSSEEINTAPHSFSPFGPVWDDGSSALITLTGEYDGSNGSGDFGLEVRRAGTHGVNDLRIRFETPGGARIRNINIRDHHDPDREYSLQNGLFLTLGPGSLINRDFATLQLFANVGAAVNPDRPLAGVRDNNPNLQYGLPAIADDSGLEVDALNGAPGVHSARYAGAEADDAANNAKLLAALADVPEGQRGARFRCVMVFVRGPDEPTPLVADRSWEGRIATVARGTGGFGYDPLFIDPASGRHSAELTAGDKNARSHRGQAARALRDQLLDRHGAD